MQLLISKHNSCSFKSCTGELCRAIRTPNEDTEHDCVAICFDLTSSPYVQVVSMCQLRGLETAECVLSLSCCLGCDTQYLENLFAGTVSKILHPWLYKLSAYLCRLRFFAGDSRKFNGNYKMKTKFLWNKCETKKILINLQRHAWWSPQFGGGSVMDISHRLPTANLSLANYLSRAGEMDLMRSCADRHELRVSLVNNGFLMAILTFWADRKCLTSPVTTAPELRCQGSGALGNGWNHKDNEREII